MGSRLCGPDATFCLFSFFWTCPHPNVLHSADGPRTQVPYTMAKQVSFDIVAGVLYAALTVEGKSAADLKWIVSVTSAFVASLCACISSQPGDMILTETFKGSSGKGFLGIVADINDKGGLPAFFTGTKARIVHVGMIITTQLVIYDIVKQALGLPATGSH